MKNFEGTHGLGHVRLADRVRRGAGERRDPFWATGFADVAIVHNGQITNYYKLRRRFEKRGYKFNTDNDSELIAVYLADKLKQGSSLEGRPPRSRSSDLDGTFSFLVSTKDEIGYAKDRLAVKPMVKFENDDLIAIASEEVSLNRLFPGTALNTIRTAAGDIRDMASIDLSRVSVTQANELIRKYGADGEDIEVINPDARHHIGVGLVHMVKLHIRGSAGYFCAGLTDGPQRAGRLTMSAGAWPTTCSAAPVVVRGNAAIRN